MSNTLNKRNNVLSIMYYVLTNHIDTLLWCIQNESLNLWFLVGISTVSNGIQQYKAVIPSVLSLIVPALSLYTAASVNMPLEFGQN